MINWSRIELNLPPEAAVILDVLAEGRKVTRSALIREALALYRIVNTAHREGRYIGIADSPDAFRTVISIPV